MVVKDALQRFTHFTHDGRGRVTSVKNPLNEVTTYTYGPVALTGPFAGGESGQIVQKLPDSWPMTYTFDNARGCLSQVETFLYGCGDQFCTSSSDGQKDLSFTYAYDSL